MSRLGWLGVIGGVLLVTLLLAASLISPLVWGRNIGSYGYGWGTMGGLGFLMIGTMGLGMLVFWVLIIGGIVWLVQALARTSGSSSIAPQGESAFDILKKRYSRGELTQEQFDTMKRDLGV